MENTEVYCKEKLKNYGFRITPQRLKIFSCLLEANSHPTAEMIYQRVRKEFPNISFDTVNRTLLCLVDKGLVKIVECGYGARHFDANLKKHYHFRCLHCKKIIDFECPEYDNIKVPENVKKKFKVLRQKIVLEGLCPECLRDMKK